MNRISKGIVLLFFCVLLPGRISQAAELGTIEERLKVLQEQVDGLEQLKQEVQALKDELKQEVQSRDDQVVAL